MKVIKLYPSFADSNIFYGFLIFTYDGNYLHNFAKFLKLVNI